MGRSLGGGLGFSDDWGLGDDGFSYGLRLWGFLGSLSRLGVTFSS